VWHIFVIRTKNRNNFQQYLNSCGIQTVIHYPIPPHKQGAYKDWNDQHYPISEAIHEQVISLPISDVITKGELEQVVEKVNNYK
jgi:dTDP-4-amino-4,6-dideoxygalactose transaminase